MEPENRCLALIDIGGKYVGAADVALAASIIVTSEKSALLAAVLTGAASTGGWYERKRMGVPLSANVEQRNLL